MDWSNEQYVRVYTRDTEEWLSMGWEARALWLLLLRKFDRAGVVETKRGPRGLAVLVAMPAEVVERALPELLEDGCLSVHPLGYLAPGFLAAQEARKSDKLRTKESRERRRAQASRSVADLVESVTKRDTRSRNVTRESQNVTVCHDLSHDDCSRDDLSRSVTLSSADPGSSADPVSSAVLGVQGGEPPRAVALTPTTQPVKARTKRAKAPETPLPADWAPNAAHREQAARLGVDPEREAGRYRDHAEAHGRRLVSWDAGFRTWLSRAAEFQGRGANGAPALERPRTYGQHPTGQWGESPGVPADLFSGPIEEGPKTAPKRPADSAVRHLATTDTLPARGGPQVQPGGHVQTTAKTGSQP